MYWARTYAGGSHRRGKGLASPAYDRPIELRRGITLDAHQKDIVDKVSSYFSGIHTLQGSFLQTSSDNRRMKGKFYLSRARALPL